MMGLKFLTILAITFSLTNLYECNAQTSQAADQQTPRDSITMSVDSLRWMYYSMNYFKKAQHYRYDSLPVVSVLECDATMIADFHRMNKLSSMNSYLFQMAAGPRTILIE